MGEAPTTEALLALILILVQVTHVTRAVQLDTMQADSYVLREATPEDAAVLAYQRRSMFEVMGMLSGGATAAGDASQDVSLHGTNSGQKTSNQSHSSQATSQGDALEAVSRVWIEREIREGTFRSWLIELGGTPVAGGGLQLRPLMPRPGHLQGHPEGLILSVWVEPAHRRQGLATRIVQAMIDWAGEHGIRRLTLHASEQGRSIYQRLGFNQTNEMRREQ